MWAALLEKAFVQAYASGWLSTNVTADSYQSLTAGPLHSSAALAHLTSVSTGAITAGNFNTAFTGGRLLVYATPAISTSALLAQRIVANHAYAVVGYDNGNGIVTLYNPWGCNTSPAYPGLVSLTYTQMTQDCGLNLDGNVQPACAIPVTQAETNVQSGAGVNVQPNLEANVQPNLGTNVQAGGQPATGPTAKAKSVQTAAVISLAPDHPKDDLILAASPYEWQQRTYVQCIA